MSRSRAIPGVFDLRNQQSIRPLLEFLETSRMIKGYVYRDVSTIGEFENLILRWTNKRYSRYPIGYLGFHGSPGIIHIGRRDVNLDYLGGLLEGRCQGKSIYFGACGVLDIPRREAQAFRRRIRAKCICGYREDVDWFESSAFDILLLDCLSYYSHPRSTDEWLKSEQRSLVRNLDFKIYY
jgi:hypothetical protein